MSLDQLPGQTDIFDALPRTCTLCGTRLSRSEVGLCADCSELEAQDNENEEPK